MLGGICNVHYNPKRGVLPRCAPGNQRMRPGHAGPGAVAAPCGSALSSRPCAGLCSKAAHFTLAQTYVLQQPGSSQLQGRPIAGHWVAAG